MPSIERIKELGYIFEKTERVGSINIVAPSGEKKPFSFETALKRQMKFGTQMIEITEKELFDSIYELTEEEMCQFEHGCSIKSYNYIQTVKKNIGLIGSGLESDMFSGEVMRFGEKSEHCYEEVHDCIEESYVEKYYFNHNPSSNDIKTAIVICHIESDFGSHLRKDTFKCYECGHLTHWLDIPGNVFEKISNLEEKYCGC